MAGQEEKKGLGEVLRHPMANVVIGFLLTGVVGGALTNYYASKRSEEVRQQAMIQARKEAISNLSKLNAEHLARADKLLTAIETGTRKEDFEELRAMYDAANVRWRTETSPALMAAREVLPTDVYYRYREHVKTEFGERFLSPLEACIQVGRRAMDTGQPVAPVLESCGARALIRQAGRCTDAMMDMLYDLANGTINEHDEDWLRREQERHEQRLADACAAPGTETSGGQQ
jgi:hypothetical protein